MKFIELTTPEGRIVINRSCVVAVFETVMDGIGCRIQTADSEESVFNIKEDYETVLKEL